MRAKRQSSTRALTFKFVKFVTTTWLYNARWKLNIWFFGRSKFNSKKCFVHLTMNWKIRERYKKVKIFCCSTDSCLWKDLKNSEIQRLFFEILERKRLNIISSSSHLVWIWFFYLNVFFPIFISIGQCRRHSFYVNGLNFNCLLRLFTKLFEI